MGAGNGCEAQAQIGAHIISLKSHIFALTGRKNTADLQGSAHIFRRRRPHLSTKGAGTITPTI